MERAVASTASRVPAAGSPVTGRTSRRRVAPGAWRSLLRAVASGRSTEHPEQRAAGDRERAAINKLLDAVASVADGTSPADLPELEPSEARRLIRSLREELMLAWSEASRPPGREEVRTVLRALDAVEDVVASRPLRQQTTGNDHIPCITAFAHDLRSPLTSILVLVDALRSGSGGPLTDVQARQLRLVYAAAFGLCSLANDLLDAWKTQVTGVDMLGEAEPVAFSVAEVMFGVRDIVLPIAEEHGIELRLGLPRVDARLGYPAPLSRVLLNLASNALRETQEGYVEMLVREHPCDRLEYVVRDTGPGIDAKVLAALGGGGTPDAFTPGGVVSRTGLGLTICRRLVAAMGGTMHVDSQPGLGTSISCTFTQRPA